MGIWYHVCVLKCLKSQWLVAGALCACAVVSVGLACCGAERSLDVMKYYAAIGTVGALGVACLIACLWTWRRPAALLLHLGFALVLGGWTYNELAGVPDGYLKLHAGRTGSVDGDFEFTLDRFVIEHGEELWKEYAIDRTPMPHFHFDGKGMSTFTRLFKRIGCRFSDSPVKDYLIDYTETDRGADVYHIIRKDRI